MGEKSESKKPSCILLQHKSPHPLCILPKPTEFPGHPSNSSARTPSCMRMLWSKLCCQHALASTAWVQKWAQVAGTPVPIPLNYRRCSLPRLSRDPRGLLMCFLMPSCAPCCPTWPSAPTAALPSTHPLPVLPQPAPSLPQANSPHAWH